MNAPAAIPHADLPVSMIQPVERIEQFLRGYVGSLTLPENLRAAAMYALFSPGKRARPVLAVRCCEAVGGSVEAALPAAAGVEMIHAFSLVHDDLPALDNDDMRRGRATTHIEHGEAMAVLAGDLLTSLAFQVLADRLQDERLVGVLTRELAVGTTGMIAGQVYDTLPCFPPTTTPGQRLELIHRNKTGALLRAACRMGALSGLSTEPDKSSLAAITVYGEAIGLMFQIVDDLLDVEQTAEHTGKRTGKDQGAGKLTYPGVMGVEASRREIERLRTMALDSVSRFGRNAAPLRELCEYLAVRTR